MESPGVGAGFRVQVQPTLSVTLGQPCFLWPRLCRTRGGDWASRCPLPRTSVQGPGSRTSLQVGWGQGGALRSEDSVKLPLPSYFSLCPVLGHTLGRGDRPVPVSHPEKGDGLLGAGPSEKPGVLRQPCRPFPSCTRARTHVNTPADGRLRAMERQSGPAVVRGPGSDSGCHHLPAK